MFTRLHQMADNPKAPLIPIATLGASTILLLISGVMMTISANKIKTSPRWANDKEIQSIYVYAATAAGLALTTFIIVALVSLLYLSSGGAKQAKNTRAGRAESKNVLSFSSFLLGGIVIALLMTGIVGVLAIMTSSRLSDVKADDETLSSAYTYAVISAIVAIGGIGTLIMALFGIAALRSYRKKALAKGVVAVVPVSSTSYGSVSTTSYAAPPPSMDESFPSTGPPSTQTTVVDVSDESSSPPVSTSNPYYSAPTQANPPPSTSNPYYSAPDDEVVTKPLPTQANSPSPYYNPVEVEEADDSFPSSGEEAAPPSKKLGDRIPTQVKDTASYVANDLATKGSDLAKQVYDQGSAYASNYVGSYLKPAKTAI